MRRYSFLLVVFSVFWLAGSVNAASAVVFGRTLRLGDRGGDVLVLQQLLNQKLRSPIALSGPGSPGHETDFFGKATAAAVVRFQEQYRAKILTPAGLAKGTGVFGSLTQAQLAAVTAVPVIAPLLMGSAPFVSPGIGGETKGADPINSQLHITSITPNSGGSGTVVTITGSGFETVGNTVYTSYAAIEASSVDGKTITIALNPDIRFKDAGLEMPIWIYIHNKSGFSNAVVFTYQIPQLP